MVAGGGLKGAPVEVSAPTEVVDLSMMTNSMCSFAQLPYPRYGAVGGMLGNAPILCGGSNGHWPTNDSLGICYIYFNSIYEFSSFLNFIF